MCPGSSPFLSSFGCGVCWCLARRHPSIGGSAFLVFVCHLEVGLEKHVFVVRCPPYVEHDPTIATSAPWFSNYIDVAVELVHFVVITYSPFPLVTDRSARFDGTPYVVEGHPAQRDKLCWDHKFWHVQEEFFSFDAVVRRLKIDEEMVSINLELEGFLQDSA